MKKYNHILILIFLTSQLLGQAKMEKEYQLDWAFYFTNVDDNFASINTDLNLAKLAPINDQPYIVYLSLEMRNPRDDGMSSSDEANKLWEIEDKVISSLKSQELNFTNVGRLTSNNYRDLYFFCKNKLAVEQQISSAMTEFPEYQFDLGSKEDKKWKSYFDLLYPLPRQMQAIQNFRVVEQIKKGGDNLSKEREVFHWIYFKDSIKLKEFEEYTLNQGYKTLNKAESKSDDRFNYMIQISRIDKVGFSDVDEYILDLWEKARELNGEYDGWETSIEK